MVLDIEGTTTPISFVKDILFPYAADKVAPFLAANWESALVQGDVALLREQAAKDKADPALLASLPGFVDVSAPPAGGAPGTPAHTAACIEALVANVHWQISHNRKTSGLKALQGHIWKAGYESGELKGQMYPDVVPAFEAWRSTGTPIFIYSSGSRQAQRLIFGHSEAGDLRKYISGYFDTNIGPKVEASSYRQILETVGVEDPGSVLFATDLETEALAASGAGMDAVLLLRSGNAPPSPNHGFPTAQTFEQLFPSSGQ